MPPDGLPILRLTCCNADGLEIDMKFFKLNDRRRQIVALIKANWFKLALASACSASVGLTTALMAYLVKPALDDVFINKDERMLILLPIFVFIVFIVKSAGAYGEDFVLTYVGHDTIRELRERLYNHIQSLPLSFFQREKTGELMSRITNDVGIVSAMFTSAVTGSIRGTFTLISLVFVIFYQIPKLAIFAFLVLPIAFYPLIELGRRIRRFRTGLQEAMAEMSAFLHETFFGNKIVKAFNMEEYEKNRFAEKNRRIFKLDIKETRIQAISSPLMELLGGIGIAFVIGYGGSRVMSGEYTAGTFMSFLTAVFMMYAPVKKISRLNNAIQRGAAAMDRIFDILERKSEILEPPNPVAIQRRSHHVVFTDVFFKYDKEMVLKGINLDVKPGEVLALVGMSGGGKTSLVNLIPRFFDVSQGAILIDDVDIRDASIASLRDQIAIVTQEPILFNDTVRNNIAYGKPTASDAEIEEAARAAYAYEFIQGFAEGFDTMIGELGGRLSGGQKQRICIARALLKDAPILILDEATSSLDTESENLVQKALENLMQGRTTFVIAHRLSTISYAHRIIVIVDGRIVEEGRHDNLMALDGEYCKLYQMQFSEAYSETSETKPI